MNKKLKWKFINFFRRQLTKPAKANVTADAGILYIVFKSKKMLNETIVSIMSVRHYNAKVRICIFTDEPDFLNGEINRLNICNVEVVSITPQHQRAKVDYINQSPFEQTIYADSDTIFRFDPDNMLKGLDYFDVLFCHDFARKRQYYSDLIYEYSEISSIIPELNGGIFAFRKNKNVMLFLKNWKELFYKYFEITHGYDQPSLRIAAATAVDVRLFVMNEEYNCRPISLLDKCLEDQNENYSRKIGPKILHTHFDIDVTTMTVSEIDMFHQNFSTNTLLKSYGR